MNPMLNTAGTTAADIPEFPMPRPPRCPFDPPQELRSLQEEGALARVRLWDGSTPWVVTRHAEQKALSTDPRVSADSDTPGYPRTADGGEGAKFSFVHLDDPEHARLRRMVSGAFTIKRVEAMRPAVQKMVNGFINDMLAGPKPPACGSTMERVTGIEPAL